MAHQTNVHIVHQTFESKDAPEQVTDPVCGMKIDRKTSRHMVFRGQDAIYFCSRACRDRFLEPTFKTKVPRAA